MLQNRSSLLSLKCTSATEMNRIEGDIMNSTYAISLVFQVITLQPWGVRCKRKGSSVSELP
jgi:hypothetical protein